MRPTASASRTLILLAPSQRAVPETFRGARCDASRHARLLADAQAFRGRVYLQDGAIKPWQLIDGRHRLEIDQGSWHLLVLDSRGEVCGCARYKEYPAGTPYPELGVSRSALGASKHWGEFLSGAVEAELELSKRLDCPMSELGGWALDEEIRGTAEALRMALATYALTQELGGAIGLSSVTRRHGSASILRRMGGRSLEFRSSTLPAYYDPQYECEMEILRFYSWAPNSRYRIWIDEVKDSLRGATVVTNNVVGPAWVATMRGRPLNTAASRAMTAR